VRPARLWQISVDAGLKKIAGMGFNTVRLPFANECLAASATSSIDTGKNPALAGKSPLQVMDYLVTRARANGLNVILDRHRPDTGGQSALWYTDRYSEATWIADWRMLAKRYRSQSNVIGFDLHNEPHGEACWGCGTRSIDWRLAAQRAGNAVLAVNPRLLIIVEGVERQSTGTPYIWWGGGLAGVAAKPVKLAVARRVVYSPHDYPSTIYNQPWFSASDYPKNLTRQWDTNWGFIDKSGVAPILIGEFGTKLETTSDKKWLRAMVGYIKKNGMSFAYWSFNPNSGDTGGLVKDDWVTKQSLKLSYLAPILGKPVTVTTDPKPPTTPTGTPTSAPPTTTKTRLTARWMLQNSWQAGYVAEFEIVGGSATAESWQLSWPDATATGIVNAWGMTCAVTAEHTISCAGADWAKRIPPGQTFRVGLQVDSTTAPSSPPVYIVGNK